MSAKDPGKKEIDPLKYFDEKEYNTMRVGQTTEEKKKPNINEELVELLTAKTTGLKDSALKLLKDEKAEAILIDAIKASRNPKNKATLIAACWESGMDFRQYLDLFAELVHDEDLFVSMEALTVISENCNQLEKKHAGKIISILEKASEDHFNAALIQDSIEKLKSLE